MRKGLIVLGVILILACAIVAVVKLSRPANVGHFPLSMATLESLTDGSVGVFKVGRGQVLVTVVDPYGDAHVHVLNHDGMSEADALARVAKKKAELDKAASKRGENPANE